MRKVPAVADCVGHLADQPLGRVDLGFEAGGSDTLLG